MRSFSKINGDIDSTKKNILRIKKDLQKNADASKGVTCGFACGLRAILWGILAAAATFIVVGAVYESRAQRSEVSIIGYIIFGALIVLFAVLAIIALRKLFVRKLKISSAVFLIILGLICMAFTAYLLYSIQQGTNPLTLLFSMTAVELEEVFSFPLEDLNRVFFIALAIFFSTALFILIGSIVSLKRTLSYNKNIKDTAQKLNAALQMEEKTLASLESELADGENEAQRLFHAEIGKELPNVEKIKELSEIGCLAAQKWLRDKKAAEDKEEGIRIFQEEQKKTVPDIDELERAARLGCSDAAILAAKMLSFSYFPALDDYAKLELVPVFTRIEQLLAMAGESSDVRYYKILNTTTAMALIHIGEGDTNLLLGTNWLQTLTSLREIRQNVDPKSEEGRFLDFSITSIVALSDASEEIKKEQKKQRRQSSTHSYSSYRKDRQFSNDEKAAYLQDKCGGMYRPSVVDNDSSLTDSEKRQLKDYIRVWGE